MKDWTDRRLALARLLKGPTVAVPGVHDALSAMLAERAGFPVLYVGSYATAAVRLGLADVGAVSMTEMVEHAASIVNAVRVPVLADAENGWNNAANIWRTVQSFERAGVSGIHIEDHEFGKHTDAAPVLASIEQATAKIEAAVAAREDPNFLIIARTDAPWATGDVQDTLNRIERYAAAGADLVMPAGLSLADVPSAHKRSGKGVVITDRRGRSFAEEAQSGAALVLYYGLSLHASFFAVKTALEQFHATLDADALPHLREHVTEFEQLMGYDAFAARARKYGVTADDGQKQS
ncbi:MAG: isocitrate lyase/PEP mutase family protein [Sulfuricaulis sp.]|nr:isocitrate lyase/PEP mutase family protein [Sulfuricaulis sp.]